MLKNKISQNGLFYIFWILFGVISRTIIHIPDATPLTSLCLLAPTVFSKRFSFFVIGAILILSDCILHFLFHYAVFGSWTLFTYFGWFGIIFFGFLFSHNPNFSRAMLFTLYASVIFWIWTNFGTWCATNLYPHTMQGLMNCYIAALPFLRNSILGSLVWTSALLFFIYAFFRHNIIHRNIPVLRN